MATIFKSSIGKKLFMSISGLFLILFLLLHGTINFFSVIDTFTGKFGAADGLFMKGCEFMALPIVTIMVPVLALGFAVHILWAMWLEYGNIKARGGFFRYKGGSKGKAESWASKNMIILGLIVLLGIALHLLDFWQHMQLQSFIGGEEENPYVLLTTTFGNIEFLVLYLIWFFVIWFHLTHGFWSAFQTIGWSNEIWMKRLKVLGIIFATLIVLIFAVVAINGYYQAAF
ncbi:MAG: succinate dehydrogenase [Bacteroidales bacterium]|nr:succinate dehydrogenase [Bacteroidales bacterium]